MSQTDLLRSFSPRVLNIMRLTAHTALYVPELVTADEVLLVEKEKHCT